MPHIEKRTGNIVIRIVYDGAPEAGKTTNLRELVKAMPLERRGELESPETTGRRTEFFDWTTFMGGYVDGRRLRCQLVSVPGQPKLLRRRRYLLDTADAVVFVADARPAAVEEGRASFRLMREAVRRRGGEVPAGVLLQANKQDLDAAMSPDALAAAMNAGPEVPTLGATALYGEGVLQTFVTAVRLATDRVKRLLVSASWGELVESESSSSKLLEQMRKIEEDLMAKDLDVGAPAVVVPRPSRLPRVHAITLLSRPSEPSGAAVSTPAPAPQPPLPFDERVGGGHVWPLVEGRRIFSELRGGSDGGYVPHRASWAPPDSVEAQVRDGDAVRWYLHTRQAWSFDDAQDAKLALIALVGQLRSLEPFLAKGRALSLRDDGAGQRIWMVSEATPTLHDLLSAATREPTPAALSELKAAIPEALRLSDKLSQVRVPCRAVTAVGVRAQRISVLAVPSEEGTPLGALRGELRAIAETPNLTPALAQTILEELDV